MHGITRTWTPEEGTKPSDPKYFRRVVVRYSDGQTTTFVPEAGRKFFGQDDTRQLVEVLTKSSSVAEWAEAREWYAK
jgi:hypothetical protein